MLPTEWFLIFRSIIMLDGIAQSLKIDLDFNQLIIDDIKSMNANIVDIKELKAEAIWLGRDVLETARILPRHVRRFVKHLEKRDYSLEFEVAGVESGLKQLARSVEFLACMILAGVFCSLSVVQGLSLNLSTITDTPVGSLFFLVLSLFSFLFGIKRLSRVGE